MRTPEEITRRIVQQAMEKKSVASEANFAFSVGCSYGSVSKLLNEVPVKLTQSQWLAICSMAGVLNLKEIQGGNDYGDDRSGYHAQKQRSR